jgi:hypothetical protein
MMHHDTLYPSFVQTLRDTNRSWSIKIIDQLKPKLLRQPGINSEKLFIFVTVAAEK